MKTIQWRHQWDADADEDADANTLIDFTGDPGMTIQGPTEEADINVIIKRFGIQDGSQLPYWNNAQGIYGDISEFPQDPTEIANIMRDADLRFKLLPADVRQRFPSPEALFDFIADPENKAEARKLGLFKPEEVPKPEPEPMKVRVVNDTPEKSSKEDKGAK